VQMQAVTSSVSDNVPQLNAGKQISIYLYCYTFIKCLLCLMKETDGQADRAVRYFVDLPVFGVPKD